jgi:hypothetical protein
LSEIKGDEKRKMKGKALVMVGILVLVLGVAIVGPMQVAAAQDYEHNWSWLAYTPGAHDWSAFDGEPKQHDWLASEGEHEPHDWSWMLPEPGATFNPNAGWWGIG